MLALKRRAGESVTLTMPDGRVIVMEIVECRGAVVRIGIQAPADVAIVRTEIIGQRP